jgi:hypothetical protein
VVSGGPGGSMTALEGIVVLLIKLAMLILKIFIFPTKILHIVA